MSDLVERLRSPGSGALWGPPITEEAADRIEALEAALRKIAGMYRGKPAHDVARTALESKP